MLNPFLYVAVTATAATGVKAAVAWFRPDLPFLSTLSPVVNGLISLFLGIVLYSSLESAQERGAAAVALLTWFIAAHLVVYVTPSVTDFYARTSAFATAKKITYEEAAVRRDRFLVRTTGSAGLSGHLRHIAVHPPGPVRPDDIPDDAVNALLFVLSRAVLWFTGTLLGFKLLGLVDMSFWYSVSWLGVGIGYWNCWRIDEG